MIFFLLLKIISLFIIIILIFFAYFFEKIWKIKPKNIAEVDCLTTRKNCRFNNINTRLKVHETNKLINENFFVIDSNNLSNISSHLYGFFISKNGIITDNYFKQLGEYEEPLPQGVYVMIRKIEKKIIINQDFYGSYGIYLYEKKDKKHFIFSNSFLLLQEYLVGKHHFSLNKDFANHLIVTDLCSYSIDETLINEIKQVPSNTFIIIDSEKKTFKIDYINYKENSISLESKEGLEIIDNWVDKWGYIFRSLKNQTDNIYFDLSGGFDTRTLLAILLNFGIKMDDLNIYSIQNNKHEHDIDYKIAREIAAKYGFKLNNFHFDNNSTEWSLKDSLYDTFYSKLGFHKEFYLKKYFFNKPRFSFSGSGGESLRGTPNSPIQKFIERNSLTDINSHKREFFCSSEKIFNRSIFELKKEKTFNNDFEISFYLYSKTQGRNHFGKSALEKYLVNVYVLQPLMDPEIKKIRYDINNATCHDLIAYIIVRFAPDLLYFPFQGYRILNLESIRKAEKLNNNYKPYKKRLEYNNNFYIDNKRLSPVKSTKNKEDAYDYLKELFSSSNYFKMVKKFYDKDVYDWANKYSYKTNYHPYKQHYSLLAIAITLNNLQLNEKYLSEKI